MQISLWITQRMSPAQGVALSSPVAERGRWVCSTAAGRMCRRRGISSCLVSLEGVWDGAVARLSCTSLALLGLLGEVLSVYLPHNPGPGWFPFSSEPSSFLSPPWGSLIYHSFLGPTPWSLATPGCFSIEQQWHGTWRLMRVIQGFYPAKTGKEFLAIRVSILIVFVSSKLKIDLFWGWWKYSKIRGWW